MQYLIDHRRSGSKFLSYLTPLLLALLLLPATADAGKRAPSQCPPVQGKVSQRASTTVFVVGRSGVSCRKARQVIRRCFKRSAVKYWHRRGSLTLRSGKRSLRLKTRSKAKPPCLQPRRKARKVKGKNVKAPAPRAAGPFQQALMLPPGSYAQWDWVSPVLSSNSANIDVGTADVYGKVRNKSGEVRSVWFEYGITRDLGSSTQRKPVQMDSRGGPIEFKETLRHLKANTRYYWRALASIGPDDDVTIYKGAIGSFVTEPYRSVAVDNPCSQPQFGGNAGGVTQVTTSLVLVCTPMQYMVNDMKIPVSLGYSGQIDCPPEYPHNLNVGSYSITIPKIGLKVSFNNLVSYWRSNDWARFTTFPGYQKHYEGAEVGPLPGWHRWDIDMWGMFAKTTRTDMQMWIHCTDEWKAFTPEQLAPEQGTDKPSTAKPPTPTGLTMTKVDGGWKASWNPVSGVVDGIAGYQLAILPTDKYNPEMSVLLTDTGTEAFRSDAYMKAISDYAKSKQLYAILFAISSEGNRSAGAAIVPFTLP
jgi:hypothetical protein